MAYITKPALNVAVRNLVKAGHTDLNIIKLYLTHLVNSNSAPLTQRQLAAAKDMKWGDLEKEAGYGAIISSKDLEGEVDRKYLVVVTKDDVIIYLKGGKQWTRKGKVADLKLSNFSVVYNAEGKIPQRLFSWHIQKLTARKPKIELLVCLRILVESEEVKEYMHTVPEIIASMSEAQTKVGSKVETVKVLGGEVKVLVNKLVESGVRDFDAMVPALRMALFSGGCPTRESIGEAANALAKFKTALSIAPKVNPDEVEYVAQAVGGNSFKIYTIGADGSWVIADTQDVIDSGNVVFCDGELTEVVGDLQTCDFIGELIIHLPFYVFNPKVDSNTTALKAYFTNAIFEATPDAQSDMAPLIEGSKMEETPVEKELTLEEQLAAALAELKDITKSNQNLRRSNGQLEARVHNLEKRACENEYIINGMEIALRESDTEVSKLRKENANMYYQIDTRLQAAMVEDNITILQGLISSTLTAIGGRVNSKPNEEPLLRLDDGQGEEIAVYENSLTLHRRGGLFVGMEAVIDNKIFDLTDLIEELSTNSPAAFKRLSANANILPSRNGESRGMHARRRCGDDGLTSQSRRPARRPSRGRK